MATFNTQLTEEYLNHPVFAVIEDFISFYESLGYQTMHWVTPGTSVITNLDTYTFDSIASSLDSIKWLLNRGRLSDSFALLRRIQDLMLTNIYVSKYLKVEYKPINEKTILEHIQGWLNGNSKMPRIKIMDSYIKKDKCILELYEILNNQGHYKELRQRGNDNMHFNSYSRVLMNIDTLMVKGRVDELNVFQKDLIAIFIQNYCYLFLNNEYYMMASDYRDCLDMGDTPTEEMKYWVAPFIQEIFTKYVAQHRLDAANYLKDNIDMQLN